MINIAKVRSIALFEFRSSVFRWSYLLVTLGLPILLGGAAGGALLLQSYVFAEEAAQQNKFGVVDEGKLFKTHGALIRGSMSVARYANIQEAKAALTAKKIQGFFLFPADYADSGRVIAYTLEGAAPFGTGLLAVERAMRDRVRRELLHSLVPAEIIDRVVDPMALESVTITAGGNELPRDAIEWGARLVVPIVIAVLLSIALVSSTALLAQALALEKQNKIVEMLIAAVSPEEILAGKLVGLGAAGLLQVLLWFSVTGVTALLATSVVSYAEVVPWSALAVAPAFFLMGYLFVGSFMLATAALGTSAPENQKIGVVWVFLTMLPIVLLLAIAQHPSGAIAHAFTWFPFTAPVTVVLRLAVDSESLPAWELAGSIACLLLCTWAAIRVGARLFRVGLLLNGGPIRWKDIVRQARL